MRNSASQWGSVAKVLHWVIAIMLLLSLAHGWWMTHLAERSSRLENYTLHATGGYDLLLLLLLRLGWRAYDRAPALPAGTPNWERIAAKSSHGLLYALTLAVCVAGWLLTGTLRRPLDADLMGIIGISGPALGREYHEMLEDTHKIIAYALLALIIVHIAAALRHHFIKRNDILRRML